MTLWRECALVSHPTITVFLQAEHEVKFKLPKIALGCQFKNALNKEVNYISQEMTSSSSNSLEWSRKAMAPDSNDEDDVSFRIEEEDVELDSGVSREVLVRDELSGSVR